MGRNEPVTRGRTDRRCAVRVLVVDDDGTCRLAMRAMVVALGYECVVAVDGGQAWRILQHRDVDVVIADRRMPGINGVQLCQLIRGQTLGRHVHIVLATAMKGRGQMLEGMLAGADDYLVKPVDMDELRLRLIVAHRITGVHRQLEQLNAELQIAAGSDALTGLGNRRSLEAQLTAAAGAVSRYGHRYGIAVIDVDHFKAFNDTYGHQCGDRALQAVASALLFEARAGDTWFRYGGEEFLGIYPQQTGQDARLAVERIRDRVALLAIPHAASPGRAVLTLSSGIAELTSSKPDIADAVHRADAALYRAKQNGRDTIELASGQ